MSTTITAIALFWGTFCINPVEDVAKDRVDLIEVNHFFDEHGKHVFDQVIFYDWSPQFSRYNVLAWRLLKDVAQVPYREGSRQDYVAIWHDGAVLRKVQAETVRESWTQYDPELVERAYLPKEQRRELLKLIVKSGSGN